jgi:hypothetical protein
MITGRAGSSGAAAMSRIVTDTRPIVTEAANVTEVAGSKAGGVAFQAGSKAAARQPENANGYWLYCRGTYYVEYSKCSADCDSTLKACLRACD